MYVIITSVGFGSVPEWPKGADCKSVVFDFGGSNPPAPTKQNASCFARGVFVWREWVVSRNTAHFRIAKMPVVANFFGLAAGKMTAVQAVKKNLPTSAKPNVDESHPLPPKQ